MNGMLNQQEVLALVGVSRATLHRYRVSGLFPAPVTIGTRTIRWPVEVVQDFIEGKWQGGMNAES